MEVRILSYRLPETTSVPNRHNTFGWVAFVDDQEVGWVNMTLLPKKTIKFEDAYVKKEYRGKGIYNKLWDVRWNYIKNNYIGYKIVAYCKETTLDFYKKQGFEEVSTTTLVEFQA